MEKKESGKPPKSDEKKCSCSQTFLSCNGCAEASLRNGSQKSLAELCKDGSSVFGVEAIPV